LSSPDQRPIASLDDNSVVVSPCDSQPQGVWTINENSNLISKDGVNIKSGVFTSVETLLDNSEYKDAFASGTLTHTFLDVNDYHRYHFPVSGIIKEVRIISGDDAVGGSIVCDKELGKYLLKASNPDWQNIETRGLIILETEEYGLVTVMPIGMSQISSVCFEDTVKVGAVVTKGDMMGCFLFGGSDIVMLFQKDVELSCQVPQQANGSYEHINTGEVYGTLSTKE
jgi:phosphatidylserine decarboxylase